MATREQLIALTDELRRLKAGGQRTVSVTEESLAELRVVVSEFQDDFEDAPDEVRPAAAAFAPAERPLKAEEPAAKAPAIFAERRVPVATPASVRVGAPIPTKAPVVVLPEGDKATRWAALRDLVLNDPVCKEHVRPGKKVVLGVGSLDAQIFFCGEAPGADEEIVGEPFVGAAGQLLTKMIQGMGLKREQVYIGNIMNWRPEMALAGGGVQIGNRPPTPEEMNYCLPYLRAQLEIVKPTLIVALGKTAAEGLLGLGTVPTLGAVRGRWKEFDGIPLMVTYHPSYILRNQSNSSKRAIWEDLLQVMEKAALPISEKQKNFFRS
ncbi:uracil-DNA glycosylase [Oleiharenicola lentus]|uniref:uracil-DNA glycosylase n=1 Tax=Oleiharenicola lentus TaxID=2508720 RepID=UPI003F66AC6D